jgi:hypothetical protein
MIHAWQTNATQHCEEANMMMRTFQSMKVRRISGYIGPSGFWAQSQNRLWELTLSLSAAVTPITESTSALASSCITQGSRRARSRLGEDRYRLSTNNCEHFCKWCTRGLHRSTLVEALRALLKVRFHRPRLSVSGMHRRPTTVLSVWEAS